MHIKCHRKQKTLAVFGTENIWYGAGWHASCELLQAPLLTFKIIMALCPGRR